MHAESKNTSIHLTAEECRTQKVIGPVTQMRDPDQISCNPAASFGKCWLSVKLRKTFWIWPFFYMSVSIKPCSTLSAEVAICDFWMEPIWTSEIRKNQAELEQIISL